MAWNPVTGCTKVSPGCANCYTERMTKRLKACITDTGVPKRRVRIGLSID